MFMLQHLFAVLQQNDYPRTLHRIECKKERQPVVVLPYIEGVSQQIAKVLSKSDLR